MTEKSGKVLDTSDFIAVCVTGEGMKEEKVLGDVPIPHGTGRAMADAVIQLLALWGLEERVIAVGIDSCFGNMGPIKGAN